MKELENEGEFFGYNRGIALEMVKANDITLSHLY